MGRSLGLGPLGGGPSEAPGRARGAVGKGAGSAEQGISLGRPAWPAPGRPVLTTCTHSMRGSRTDWFPDRLTTQACVSGVASSSAMTASMPILLL